MSKFPIILAMFFMLAAAGTYVWWKDGKRSTANASNYKTAHRGDAHSKSRRGKPSKQKSRYEGLVDESLPIHTRLEIARSIDTGIKAADVDLLITSLEHNPSENQREQWWLVLNEVIEQLRKKGVVIDRLGSALIDLVDNPKQSEVVRDYAIQHLSQWMVPDNSDTSRKPSSELVTKALDSIVSTITDPSIANSSIPGTSIMALTSVNLSEKIMEPVWSKLDPVLITIVKGERYGSLATKTTIIQSLALRNNQDHLPFIRSLAHKEKTNPSIRLSSIAALGVYRSENDRIFLQSIARGDTRYRYAAESALKKFSK